MTITVNKQQVKTFNFSGGECHVTIENIEIGDVTNVEAYLCNSDDIMRLLMVVDAIRQENQSTEISLIIHYSPYAHEDSLRSEGFSTQVMVGLVNGLNCSSVVVVDDDCDVVVQVK